MKNILVTGGAGFIGSNFVRYALEETNCNIINLDALTYAGNLDNLSGLDVGCHFFIKGDIRDDDLVDRLFVDYDIDTVINFAAESHVDRSIENPKLFLETNVIGVQTLLDCAKRHWSLTPEDKYCIEYRPGVRFLQISTDEVYGALGNTGSFTEDSPLAPNSPYSASKAAADLLVSAYSNTYALPVNITRCSNNYGPYQFPEKFIPLMISNSMNDKPLPVYGDGRQIRDWLYVLDHCSAILTVLKAAPYNEIYNIGGNNEIPNIELARMILSRIGKSASLIEHVRDRLGHDRRYAIDSTKIATLGWFPKYSFEDGLTKTIQWYSDNAVWLNRVTDGEYMEYYRRMYGE